MMRKCFGAACLSALAGFAQADAVRSVQLHSGDDIGIAVKDIVASRKSIERGEIVLLDGVYSITNTVVLGADASNLTIRASKPGGAVIVGGVAVRGRDFRILEDSTLLSRLPQASRGRVLRFEPDPALAATFRSAQHTGGGSWYYADKAKYRQPSNYATFPSLVIDGKAATLARWPNAGEWFWFSPSNTVWKDKSGAKTQFSSRTGREDGWKIEDSNIGCAGWIQDCTFLNSCTRVLERNRETGALVLENAKLNSDFGRAYFFNVVEELDQPGEWCFDPGSGLVLLYPPDGFSPASVVAIGSTKEALFHLEGRQIRIEGLDINGKVAQPAIIVDGEARECEIRDCRFSGVGNDGVWMAGRKNAVRDCEFVDMVSTGVILLGGDVKKQTAGENVVDNCTFRRCALMNTTWAMGAANVDGVGNTLSHCEISEMPEGGIYYAGYDNVIEYNRVYDVCREMDDAGAVYTPGGMRSYNLVFRYNDISAFPGQVTALYFDDTTSGHVAYGNILRNAGCNGILLGGGRDNVISNNVIIGGFAGITMDNRGLFWPGYIGTPEKKWREIFAKRMDLDNGTDARAKKYPRLAAWYRHPQPLSANIDNVFVQNVIIDPSGFASSYDIGGTNVVAAECNTWKDNLVVRRTGGVRYHDLILHPEEVATNEYSQVVKTRKPIGFSKLLDGTPENPVDIGFVDMPDPIFDPLPYFGYAPQNWASLPDLFRLRKEYFKSLRIKPYRPGDMTLLPDARLLKELPGFKPIPFGKIGLRYPFRSKTKGAVSENYARGGSDNDSASPANPPPADARYRNPSLPIEERIDDLLKWMTPCEKMQALHSCTFMSSGRIKRIGLAEFHTIDGGSGPRAEMCVTYLPCGVAWAATWDRALAGEIGQVAGEETRGVYSRWVSAPARMLLGPGGNIGGRTPFGARSFEYMGEDPLLAGRTAACFIRGLQSCGVAACMKHYVCNDQEWCRTVMNVELSERALREIYVRPFEIAIREGDVWAIMNGYNAVRGTWMSWNRELNDILYRDCGWSGALYSDWAGYRDDLKAIAGGTTVETRCFENQRQYRKELEDLAAGRIRREDFDDQLRRALRLYFRVGAFDTKSAEDVARQDQCEQTLRSERHRKVAYRAAAESFVLLENRDSFLPLDAGKVRTVALVGPNADQYHSMIDGTNLIARGGSGAVKAAREVTPLEGFCQVLGERNVLFAPGFRFENANRANAVSVPALVAMDPIEAAKKADLVVFCGGYDHSVDREVLGWGQPLPADRDYLTFKPGPNGESQEELIRKVAAVNPNVVVAVTCGGPFTTEGFRNVVKGIIVTWYGGEFGGRVLADMILGKVNPSGKLPYTFGRKPEDWPSVAMGRMSYPGVVTNAIPNDKVTDRDCTTVQEYRDDIWVGYRGFDHFGTKPLYPFGYGLSYTTFKIEPAGAKGNVFSVKVTNTGSRKGREVVQCYVTKPAVAGVEFAEKELTDYASVELEPGESKTVALTVKDDACRYWCEKKGQWEVPSGIYRIRIGNASDRTPVSFEYNKE